MKIAFSTWFIVAILYLAIPLVQQTDANAFFGFLSELPVLAVTVWLFLKLANLHLETMDRMIDAFGQREQNQRENHRQMIDSLLKILGERKP